MTQLTPGGAGDRAPVCPPTAPHHVFVKSTRDGAQPVLATCRLAQAPLSDVTTSDNDADTRLVAPECGRFLAFEEQHAATLRDIMILPMDGDEASGWRAGVPFPFVQAQPWNGRPGFSPDGRWIAYSSTGVRPLGNLRAAIPGSRRCRAGVFNRVGDAAVCRGHGTKSSMGLKDR
jgi:Tol biopolymer transport system component